MILAQEAFLARTLGETSRAADLAAQALPLELEAAGRIPKTPRSEPTRSILYCSAAALAYHAGDFQVARRLVAEGLSGYPSPRVEQELKDLLTLLDEPPSQSGDAVPTSSTS